MGRVHHEYRQLSEGTGFLVGRPEYFCYWPGADI